MFYSESILVTIFMSVRICFRRTMLDGINKKEKRKKKKNSLKFAIAFGFHKIECPSYFTRSYILYFIFYVLRKYNGIVNQYGVLQSWKLLGFLSVCFFFLFVTSTSWLWRLIFYSDSYRLLQQVPFRSRPVEIWKSVLIIRVVVSSGKTIALQ